jgi:heme iron utilization protein
MPPTDPYLPADAKARSLAASLLLDARHAALAVIDPLTGTPNISRIALLHNPSGPTLTLISTLSAHTLALQTNAACAFMVGEPGAKGDPLTHPRLMVQATADILSRDHADHIAHRTAWLQAHPKAGLYLDFADFRFVVFHPLNATLNAGFGSAYRLGPMDLRP